jgi:hypothetical protein
MYQPGHSPDSPGSPRPPRALKNWVEDYESRPTQQALHRAPAERSKRKKKGARRATNRDGLRLPTEAEIGFVRLIAGYVRFRLPENFDSSLWFVRCFLDAFHYGGGKDDTSMQEVKRRAALAREFAFEGRTYKELAAKCEIAPPEAEILFEYGLQRLPSHWLAPDEPEDDADARGNEEPDAGVRKSEWFDDDTDDDERPLTGASRPSEAVADED